MNNGSRDGGGGDENFAYDVAFRETVADIISIRELLMANRPLEALRLADVSISNHRPHLPDYSDDDDQ